MPATGRYAAQGRQVRAGLELWSRRAGTRLLVEDDCSQPEQSARAHVELLGRGCRFVLGPYGSDSTRATAEAVAGWSGPNGAVWNHGGAADDVQHSPGVVSVPSPASQYLVALGRAVAAARPAASIAVVSAGGRFARFARQGLKRAAPSLGVRIVAAPSFADPTEELAAARPDAIIACGPLEREVELFRTLGKLVPDAILGGVSPGLVTFPELVGADAEGLLAPVQWHPELGSSPELGPSSAEVTREAHESGPGELDYVAAQAYAAALIADHCLALAPDDPVGAARRLRTTTFFGGFELDPDAGIQRGHRLSVIQWRRGNQELVLAEAD